MTGSRWLVRYTYRNDTRTIAEENAVEAKALAEAWCAELKTNTHVYCYDRHIVEYRWLDDRAMPIYHDAAQARKHAHNASEIMWDGVLYPSKRKLAEALGVSVGTVFYYMRCGYTGSGDLQHNRAHKIAIEKPMLWDGILYPSQQALADFLGVTSTTVAQYRRQGYTSSADITRRIMVCVWDGIEYPSINQLHLAMFPHMGYQTVRRWVLRGYTSLADVERANNKRYQRAED